MTGKNENNEEKVLKGVHILVVDDSDDLREILEFILQSKGADVDTACDGAEAIDKSKSVSYDLILMDMRMPGMDGLQTAKKIRDVRQDSKIIVLTGDVDTKEFLKSNTPFNDYIVKPIDPLALSMSILKNIA